MTDLGDRTTYLGGSDAAAALGLDRFCSPLDLFLSKTAQLDRSDETPAMTWGKLLEQPVADHYATVTGKKVRRDNVERVHPRFPWLRAHLDRRVVGESRGLEVKTSSAWMSEHWGEPGTDDVPEAYVIQCTAYMAITGLEAFDLAALIGGNDFRIYTIPRDQALIDLVEQGLAAFWERVERNDPPPPSSNEEASRRWRAARGKTATATPEIVDLVHDLAGTKRAIKALDAQKDALELRLKTFLADATELVAPDGKPLATWREQVSNRLDVAAVRMANPDLAQRFTVATTSRVLRLKDTKEQASD